MTSLDGPIKDQEARGLIVYLITINTYLQSWLLSALRRCLLSTKTKTEFQGFSVSLFVGVLYRSRTLLELNCNQLYC